MTVWVINMGEPIPELDGGGRRFRYAMLTNALIEARHNVVRWTSTFRHISKDFRHHAFASQQFNDQLSFRFLHGLGYKLHRSPRRLLHHFREARNFREASRREAKPDLVVVSIPTLDLAREAAVFGRASNVPVVIDVSDCWPDHYLTILPKRLRTLARPLLFRQYAQLRTVLSSAAGVTAISETYRQWACSHGAAASSAKVFPIGYEWPTTLNAPSVPQAFVDVGFTESDFVVLFVGTFTASYDFVSVIDAARNLAARKDSRVQFAFVGAGPREAMLRNAASEVPNIHLLGWINSPKELAAVVSHSAVGLLPYRHDCTMSLPNKPFEFMAAGKPVVSSLEGEYRTLLEETAIGLHYRSSSSEQLVDRLTRLIENKNDRMQMSRNAARLFTDRFSSESIYPRFAEFLKSLRCQTKLELQKL